jgi:hypothetical protein
LTFRGYTKAGLHELLREPIVNLGFHKSLTSAYIENRVKRKYSHLNTQILEYPATSVSEAGLHEAATDLVWEPKVNLGFHKSLTSAYIQRVKQKHSHLTIRILEIPGHISF